jgi:hypothetical protein
MKLLFLLLFVQSAFAANGLWVWSNESYRQGSVIFDAEEQKTLQMIITEYNIDEIYLDMLQIVKQPSNRDALKKFVRSMQEFDVKVEVLLGNHSWSYLENHSDMRMHIARAIKMIDGLNIDTIHLDVEPQALLDWDAPKRRADLVRQYLMNMKNAAHQIHGAGYQMAVDSGFYYDQVYIADKTLAHQLMETVDKYVIMSYRDKVEGADGIKGLIETELNYCDVYKTKAKVYAAVDTVRNDRYPKVSFFDNTGAELKAVMDEVESLKNRCLKGLSLHDYWHLKALD